MLTCDRDICGRHCPGIMTGEEPDHDMAWLCAEDSRRQRRTRTGAGQPSINGREGAVDYATAVCAGDGPGTWLDDRSGSGGDQNHIVWRARDAATGLLRLHAGRYSIS